MGKLFLLVLSPCVTDTFNSHHIYQNTHGAHNTNDECLLHRPASMPGLRSPTISVSPVAEPVFKSARSSSCNGPLLLCRLDSDSGDFTGIKGGYFFFGSWD